MARYIDADKALEFIRETNANYHWLLTQYNASWIYDFIESQPTADVAPKSEVEELKKAYANYEETTGLKQAKQEVAREIFAEIEKVLTDNEVYFHQTDEMREAFYELKKKYIKKKYIGE